LIEAGGDVAADATIFFGLWLQKPLRIAAATPSGARIADAIARHVPFERPGPVLELGAGTGSLTGGLVRAGCPLQRIIALERERRFVNVLHDKFPGLTVIEGDATLIGEYLRDRVERLSAVISSIPIKWFPLPAQRAVIEPCLELLGPGGSFLQLTNAFSSPLPMNELGISGREICRIWSNLLPAQIWSYSLGGKSPAGARL
jgi:phosphatidylethanolamine/phosphatidyl-N-methylethanolamine N-methyltransferase